MSGVFSSNARWFLRKSGQVPVPGETGRETAEKKKVMDKSKRKAEICKSDRPPSLSVKKNRVTLPSFSESKHQDTSDSIPAPAITSSVGTAVS